jgi:uncharacterized protein YegP (UPF0339 family)
MARRKLNIRFYRDKKGEFRWRMRSPNNAKIIAASSEGFKTLGSAINNWRLVEGAVREGVSLDVNHIEGEL